MRKIITLIALISAFRIFASDVNIPNIFVANQPAVASEVNGNFTAVKNSVDDNNTRLESLESLVTQLQNDLTSANNTINSLNSRIISIENNTVLELDGLLMYSELNGYATAEFTSVNVQINDGTNSTSLGGVNGLGNVIIGYNEASNSAPEFCSDPQYSDSVNCIGNLHDWGRNVHRGSHNLILGYGNSYDNHSAIIGGHFNISNNNYASVISGNNNTASGEKSAILGGDNNTASGETTTVSGGRQNQATRNSASVSGGWLNTASAITASVTGGRNNQATALYTTVTGGTNNQAAASFSSVSGGFNRSATDDYDWVAGSLTENQ